MERDFIRIRIDDYAADINLSTIHTLPRSSFRRIVRMLVDSRNLMREDVDTLGGYLQEEISRRKEKWDEVSRIYVNEWKLVPRSEMRKKKCREILEHNRKLKSDVKQAKAMHDKYQALLAIFITMTADYFERKASL